MRFWSLRPARTRYTTISAQDTALKVLSLGMFATRTPALLAAATSTPCASGGRGALGVIAGVAHGGQHGNAAAVRSGGACDSRLEANAELEDVLQPRGFAEDACVDPRHERDLRSPERGAARLSPRFCLSVMTQAGGVGSRACSADWQTPTSMSAVAASAATSARSHHTTFRHEWGQTS